MDDGLSKKYKRIIELAKKTAKTSDHARFMVGSVVFKKKSIYASQPNFLTRTHPAYHRINPLKTIHSEAASVLSCRHKNDLTGCSVCVVRFSETNGLLLSKPCIDCQVLMKMYGISHVVYSTNLGFEEMYF